MSLEFKEEQITEYERLREKPFIGYFSPNGSLINYNILLGGNYHEAWQNPVSWTWLNFVSYIIPGTSIEELKKANWYDKDLLEESVTDNQYPGINECVKRGYELHYDFNFKTFDEFLKRLDDKINNIEDSWHTFGSIEDYKLFEYHLLLFFKNAYRDKKFFDSIQRKILIEDPSVVQKRLRYEYRNWNSSDLDLNTIYHNHLKRELLSYFKDICVQYLGYDSLERFKPNGEEIKIPYQYQDFDFLTNPRVITSSYPNINERYYNYLLMDWVVRRLPRYYYNEKTGLYEKSTFSIFYQSEKEKKLVQKIQSIKKFVPLNERKKYFR